MSYKVKIDIFEGPFDLLVYLIERAGVSIYDVNISEITAQYIEYVDEIKMINPETAADFMLLAATLIHIKSKMLLPGAENELQFDEEDDPRRELAEKLKEYKKYKYLAGRVDEKIESGNKIHTKPQEDLSPYSGEPVENLNFDVSKFIDAFTLFIEKKQRIEAVKKRYQRVARERMTMEAKSLKVYSKLNLHKQMKFSELLEGDNDVFDVVLTFVTLLEMLARNVIDVWQEKQFSEINISLKEEA